MKWTTANVKNPNYTENHEIYVGTHTGSFKTLTPANEDNPYAQVNLHELSALENGSKITALAFGNDESSEILIGRAQNTVQVHCLRSQQVVGTYQVESAPVVGVARYENTLIAGIANGQVQCLPTATQDDESSRLVSSGDDMAHLRQCTAQRNIIATGGKGRQNNLKVYDMAADGKQIFNSKNLPNDYLQLEVPVWDSDIAFIDAPHTLATCSRHGYVRVYDTRKQRRPVQCFASEEPQMSFATLTAQGNYIYTGTTMGSLKAFDIRRLKNFVHTYKGFTGAVTDLCLDHTGKFIASTCLDRYVRVHHADSCVLMYQAYIKSKGMRVLLRQSLEKPESGLNAEEQEVAQDVQHSKSIGNESADEEYEQMFETMQTICDSDDEPETLQKPGVKRKNKTSAKINKKKKA